MTSAQPQKRDAAETVPIQQRMLQLVHDLYPICRSITGNGLRQSLAKIGEIIPIEMREVASGSQAFDWKIPPEWNVDEAFIEDENGSRIVDFRNHNLHLVNYSQAVDVRLSLKELLPRLHSLPDKPDWIPYRTSYYSRTWGFCVPDRLKQSLPDRQYHVKIEAAHDESGSLTYGELLLPGRSDREILFTSHVCHPSLANDNLSSVAVAVALAQHVAELPERRHSYRFLFAPGTIGALAWLAQNPVARRRVAAGLVLALLGDSQPLTYKQTKHGNSRVDNLMRYVLRERSEDHRVLPFAPSGYDERQFASVGIDLPMGRLSRATENGFEEYHTSADNLDLVQGSQLSGSYDCLCAFVDCLEHDRYFVNQANMGEPQLGRRGLYPLPVQSPSQTPGDLQSALMWNLAFADGHTGLAEISGLSGLPYTDCEQSAALASEAALLSEVPLSPSAGANSVDPNGHGHPSTASLDLNRRAHEIIPGGAHTYAKGDDQYPSNAPRFIESGRGCHVFDTDGNLFIEYGMGLRAVALGHAFEPVVAAANQQLMRGSNFTRPAALELEAAEELLQLLPAADMVKFAKNGSDATTAAIRLSRAATGRQRVLVCGDHPFFSVDDWFIGTTPMNAGIPSQAFTPVTKFPYNDLASLQNLFEESKDEFACLIMEAANYTEPHAGYLQAVQQLCRENGTIFILDEMITGFRWHLGGAQAEYGISPDLSTFGKALGNGLAVSALAGKREIMQLGGLTHDQRRVFLLSYTHGAETQGLAAAQATIRTYRNEPVIETLYERGRTLRIGLQEIARDLGIQQHFYLLGRDCNLIYVTEDAQGQRSQGMRTLLLQELIKRGVLAPSLVVSYAHAPTDIEQTLDAFLAALQVYAQALEDGWEMYLEGQPSKPVFRDRN